MYTYKMKQFLGLCLVLALTVTWAAAYEEETYEEAVRTLKELSELRKAAEERKRELNLWEEERGLKELEDKFDCKADGEACRVAPKCCGDLQCYWPDGFSLKQDGVCVTCVKVNNTCQRDKQCCGAMHCEKAKSTDVDGSCMTAGPGLEKQSCVGEEQKCRTNGMCCDTTGDGRFMHCDKAAWYHLDGKCGIYRSKGSCWKNSQCVTKCNRKWYQINGQCS